MLILKAEDFYTVTGELRSLRGALSDAHSMRETPEGDLEITGFEKDAILRRIALDQLTLLKPHLATLGAKITLMAMDEMAAHLEGGALLTYEGIKAGLDDIDTQLRRELSVTKVFVLSPHEQDFFEPKAPLFGKDFDDKFRSNGTFELDEAAKCMAFSRPTAAVFHLMRIMEIGIRTTAKCLGIPDPVKPYERTWGEILKKIRDEGWAKKWPRAADRMQGDGAFFEALHASLDAVKNPLRDNTMHIENKYTDSEARHIFELVKGFMMKLASRCDENGDPKA